MAQLQGSLLKEETVTGASGMNLFIRSWRPEGQARAVLVIVPGFNSHSAYYAWVGEQLAASGIATYAVDLRGRGRSDGERFYVQSFSDYVSDAGTLVSLAKTRETSLPLFLFGHSAGGVVASLYAVDHQADLAGFICEDFAFQIPAPDFALAVFKGLGHVAPHAHVLHLKNEDFSRDPAVVRTLNEDPLIAHETQPSQTLAEMVRADEELKNAFPRFTLPLLIIHGTADKVTKPSGSQMFYDKAGSSDKTLKLYEGSFHDPLHDIDKEKVMADIKGWVEQRIR
jgi:alpha-beta hydrolase superfamily lysophospholipase